MFSPCTLAVEFASRHVTRNLSHAINQRRVYRTGRTFEKGNVRARRQEGRSCWVANRGALALPQQRRLLLFSLTQLPSTLDRTPSRPYLPPPRPSVRATLPVRSAPQLLRREAALPLPLLLLSSLPLALLLHSSSLPWSGRDTTLCIDIVVASRRCRYNRARFTLALSLKRGKGCRVCSLAWLMRSLSLSL